MRAVTHFETGHQLRQPATWLYLILLLAATLLMATSSDPVGTGTLFNAPIKIVTFSLLVGLLGTLVTAGLFVEAGHRDIRWRMDPLLFTTPLSRWKYLGGRFFGALIVNALLLLGVPLALLLSAHLPALTPGPLGPFRMDTYLVSYAGFLLPNLLVNAAVLFGITVLSRRSLPGYLGGLGLLAVYLVGVNLTVGMHSSWILALLDPTGAVALGGLTEGWTRAERDSRPIEVEGLLLWNRIIWASLAAGMLAFTYHRFRHTHARPASRRSRTPRPETVPARVRAASAETANVQMTETARSFGAQSRARQTLAVAGLGVQQTVLSRDFLLVSIGLSAFALLMGVEMLNDPMFGLPLWPVTNEVVADLTGRPIRILVALLTIFYAGELTWKERDARIDRIRDTVPTPDWVLFAGNFLALSVMLAVVQCVLMAAGMLAQALQGFYDFEPLLYVQILFGLQLPDYLLFGVLALLVHVMVNHKYLGHLAAVLLFAGILQAGRLDIEHNLLIYGSDPGWIHSDLNGFGPSLAPFVLFKLYWGGWAVLLSVVALLFWVRGAEDGLRERIRIARERLTPRIGAGVATAALLVVTTGGFIFYNTNVLNDYRGSEEADAARAAYESRYKRFQFVPQPWLSGVGVHAEVVPERREVTLRGTYRLENRSSAPIDSIHISSFPEVSLRQLQFDRATRPVLEDFSHGYRIYRLRQALQPGDTMQMQFEIRLSPRGFRNRSSASANSTLLGEFTHVGSWLLPGIGYQAELREISDPEARRAVGLGPQDPQASIEDPRARRIARISPNADWIDFQGTIGTASGHIAVLPGALQRSWIEGKRRYFHYRSETPIPTFYALLSGEYAIHKSRWNDVDIRVLHHPNHAFNVDRIVRNVKISLDYLASEFGPYPHSQFSMLEFPRYGNFARAYPGQTVYTEKNPIAIARMEGDDPREIDGPLLITAHELAHQWWGKQVLGAAVQGASALSETLAQYSAVMVLERTHGAEPARQFLRNLHASYLAGRGNHATPEVPLLHTTDHEYIHYRKGPVVMYALQSYIGEDRVNAALRRMVERHAFSGPPYATASDLYQELQAVTPDSLQYLLEDLFATITLWDLQATQAEATPVGGGVYRVTLGVQAAKMRSDSLGNDTPIAMNDLVEVGVFGDDGEPLYLRKHRIKSGEQTMTITVQGKPARAGIDPYHRLITRRIAGLNGAKVVDVELPAKLDPKL